MGGHAEYLTFTSGQPEGGGVATLDSEDSESVDLKSQQWNAHCEITGGKLVESFSGLSKQVGFDGRDLDSVDTESGQHTDSVVGEKTPIFKSLPVQMPETLCMMYLSILIFPTLQIGRN